MLSLLKPMILKLIKLKPLMIVWKKKLSVKHAVTSISDLFIWLKEPNVPVIVIVKYKLLQVLDLYKENPCFPLISLVPMD